MVTLKESKYVNKMNLNVKAQISNECQMTNAKICVHPLIQTQPTPVKMRNGKKINN
jgi:hypothetical protein